MLEQAVGEHVETEAELLSMHFFAAQEHHDAWRYACLAGRRADDKYANVDAAALFERALAAARRLPDLAGAAVADVWEALGDVRERTGNYDAALTAYRTARQLIRDDPVGESGLLLKTAKIQERTGRYSGAIRWIRKGLAVLDGVPGPAAAQRRARLASWFGVIRLAQGRAKEAVEWCGRAIDAAVAAGDREGEAHACQTLDWAYVSLGRRDQAVYSARALELFEALDDLSGQAGVLNNLGVFAYYVGEWDKAVDYYEQAGALELRTGNAVHAAVAAVNVGEVLADQGHLDAAEEMVRDALRVFRAARYGYNIGFSTSILGRIAARRGHYDEALEHLGRAHEELVNAELAADVLVADAWTAEAVALSGDAVRALELADSALARVTDDDAAAEGPVTLLRVRGAALAQLGDRDAAIATLRASIAAAREHAVDYEVALGLELLGRLTDDAEASAECAVIFERLGVRRVPEFPLARRTS